VEAVSERCKTCGCWECQCPAVLLERIAQLEAELNGWDGKCEAAIGCWYHLKEETIQLYVDEIAQQKARIAHLEAERDALIASMDSEVDGWAQEVLENVKNQAARAKTEGK